MVTWRHILLGILRNNAHEEHAQRVGIALVANSVNQVHWQHPPKDDSERAQEQDEAEGCADAAKEHQADFAMRGMIDMDYMEN